VPPRQVELLFGSSLPGPPSRLKVNRPAGRVGRRRTGPPKGDVMRPLTILLLIVIVLLLFFLFSRGRRRL
jgi:hypothetical protein